MFKHFVPLVYGLSNGIFSASESALASGAGMLAMSCLGYNNFNVSAVLEQALLGNAFISTLAGASSQSLGWYGFFRSDYQKDLSGLQKMFLSSAFIGLKILNAVFGQALEKIIYGNLRREDEIFNILALGAIIILVPMWGVDKYIYKNLAPLIHAIAAYCHRIYRLHEEDEIVREDESEYVNAITYSPRTYTRMLRANPLMSEVVEMLDTEEKEIRLQAFSI